MRVNKITIDGVEYTVGGSGGGGTTDYTDLENKPQVNGVTLTGNKTAAQLGLASASQLPTASTAAPLMDGTASYGSGTTYARGNHRHPTDTSRAADNAVVHLSGDEAVDGAKTFSDLRVEEDTQLTLMGGNDSVGIRFDEGGGQVVIGNSDDEPVTLTGIAEGRNDNDAVNMEQFTMTLSTYATNSTVVHKASAETITGTKTFNAVVKLKTGFRLEPVSQDVYGVVASLASYEDDAPVLVVQSIGDGQGTVPSDNVIVRGLELPSQSNDAATKGYVDGIVGNIETLLSAI